MNDIKIQWHPGFVAAMNLEFKDDRENLLFEKEHNLNTKPLAIDLLIIKKKGAAPISNEIGQFFRGHNILEYKSPKDRLDIDAFYKTLAYASLYKSYGRTLDEIRADDITMSLIRETKPLSLFRYFQEHNCTVSDLHNGIYCVEGPFPFPAQVIATGELNKESHTWLNALSEKLNERDIRNLLDKINQITEKNDREMASSILEVSVEANKQIIETLRGDARMFETLMEIMEPKINEIRMEERREGIQATVKILRKLKLGDSEIKPMIMEQYGLHEQEAEEYL